VVHDKTARLIPNQVMCQVIIEKATCLFTDSVIHSAIFNNTEAAAEHEYIDIRTLIGASNAEIGSEDTDERTVTSHTYAEPEDTDLKTEVSKLLSKNEALQNILGDVADRINKYKHRSEGIIGITLLDIQTGASNYPYY